MIVKADLWLIVIFKLGLFSEPFGTERPQCQILHHPTQIPGKGDHEEDVGK